MAPLSFSVAQVKPAWVCSFRSKALSFLAAYTSCHYLHESQCFSRTCLSRSLDLFPQNTMSLSNLHIQIFLFLFKTQVSFLHYILSHLLFQPFLQESQLCVCCLLLLITFSCFVISQFLSHSRQCLKMDLSPSPVPLSCITMSAFYGLQRGLQRFVVVVQSLSPV